MALNLTKIRPFTKEPFDESLGNDTNDFLKWAQIVLNTLIGQQVTPGAGFGALQNPSINPSTAQLTSSGGRVASLTTNFGFTATTNTITLYWDGTNSSTILRIYRDDGSVAGPFPGSQLVTGLNANTPYFFYPYFDDIQQLVKFVSVGGAVGTPPIAYTGQSIAVAQQQILRSRIPLASNLAITGITTPNAGSTPATNLGGSGGGPGAFLGSGLKLP